ncbi:hypothetical protein A9R05_37975 (plasmid) [Burkholderia sp. KK1]|nr:hypothetical protein A9R05_37975 [Burkholderia sp. KK1]
MSSTVCKFISGLFVLLSTGAVACVPSENFDIYFKSNSAEIPVDEVMRLANWVAKQQAAYANHVTKEITEVSGHAETSEHDPQKLAEARLVAGKRLLEQLGFLRGEVESDIHLYEHTKLVDGKRVEISFLPACPNVCCPANSNPLEETK